MDYGVKDYNDHLYFTTFKDWMGEVNKLIFGDEEIYTEIDNSCFEESERFCYYEVTRNIFTKGVIGICLFALFMLMSYVASKNIHIDKHEKDDEEGTVSSKKSKKKSKGLIV